MRLSSAAALALLPAAILVASCATDRPPPRTNTLDARMQGNFFYNCTNGDRIEVRFAADAGVAVLIRGDERIEMQRQPTFSGFIYTSGRTQMMGNGNNLQVNVPGFAPLNCTMEQ